MDQAPELFGPTRPPASERDAFVFVAPNAPVARTVDEDLPPRTWTVARIVATVLLVSSAIAASLYAVGLLVKLQVERVFVP